jgi:hypothetical protein
MATTIQFVPVYDRYTKRSGILIDTAFLTEVKLDLYERQKTDLTALDMLNWLQQCVDKAEENIKLRRG